MVGGAEGGGGPGGASVGLHAEGQLQKGVACCLCAAPMTRLPQEVPGCPAGVLAVGVAVANS